jgi:hypothetical protein
MNLIRYLLEEFVPVYTIKRKTEREFEVAKFTDKNFPDVVYKVWQSAPNDFSTDSPAFHRMRQDEKHIKLVKRFLRDGEPDLAAYKFDTSGIITRRDLGAKGSEMVQGVEPDAGRFPFEAH